MSAPLRTLMPLVSDHEGAISTSGRIACSGLFLLLGLLFVDRAGIQTDEALFAAPLFRPWQFFSIRIGVRDLDLMNMSYNGALKTWLYAPIFHHYPPSTLSIRIPAILLGCATIWMLWRVLLRLHSSAAAFIGCALLATDTSFLLTTTFDWGPVALQHFLLIASMILALQWLQQGSTLSLAASALCCGLAFWDKAIFLWTLAGIVAAVLPLGNRLWRRISWRTIALSGAAFCLGSLPLIVYNLSPSNTLATIRANAPAGRSLNMTELSGKASVLRATWEGSALFGYLVHDDAPPSPRGPHALVECVSFYLHSITGDRRTNYMTLALTAALVLLVVVWSTPASRVALAALLASSVSWLAMASAGGGGSAHHVVLLWPIPHLVVAVAFAETYRRFRWGKWMIALGLPLLAGTNLLVTNQYLYQFVRNGAADSWTQAIGTVADDLRKSDATAVVLPDWGMTDSLTALNENRPPVQVVVDSQFLGTEESPDAKAADLHLLGDARAAWVLHTPGHEFTEGVNNRILRAARAAGFTPATAAVYSDRYGRPILQIVRFIPVTLR